MPEALFLPADPPRDGVLAVAGGPDRLTVVVAPGDRTAEIGVTRVPVTATDDGLDRKSTRLNSSHLVRSRMPSSA